MTGYGADSGAEVRQSRLSALSCFVGMAQIIVILSQTAQLLFVAYLQIFRDWRIKHEPAHLEFRTGH